MTWISPLTGQQRLIHCQEWCILVGEVVRNRGPLRATANSGWSRMLPSPCVLRDLSHSEASARFRVVGSSCAAVVPDAGVSRGQQR